MEDKPISLAMTATVETGLSKLDLMRAAPRCLARVAAPCISGEATRSAERAGYAKLTGS